jgi:2,5-diamino-6-(ribosylamino)-4(3H)-pyrimidinone 5'-phosphate reductase
MMPENRPYVVLNIAVSVDGKTDTVARQGAAISSPHDRQRVDRLRAESDAVMVGGRTLLGDDPRLTVKSGALRAERQSRGLSENPIKVGVVSIATLRSGSRFLTAGPARIVLFTTQQTDPQQVEQLRQHGAEVVVIGEKQVNLPAALLHLKNVGVERLLVEGGGTLNMELMKLKLIDEIYLYIAPLIFGGEAAPTFVDGTGLERDEAVHLKLIEVVHHEDGDVLLHYQTLF